MLREYWLEDEPEMDGPRSNSSARKYTGEHHSADVQQQTIYEQPYVAQRRASAPAAQTASNPHRGRRTTTEDQQRRRDATAPTVKSLPPLHEQTWSSTRRSTTQTQDQKQVETEKIKVRPGKPTFLEWFLTRHWLFYIGFAICSVIVVWLVLSAIVTAISTWYYNAFAQPMPTTISYATVKLPNGHKEEVHGFVDSQDRLNVFVIRDDGSKPQLIQGPDIKNVVPDPQHCIILVTISQDGKSATVIARGPLVDEGLEAKPQEAEMNIK